MGGQNPLHMRMRKLRGPHMKKSMPFEPFRTHTQPVNLADLNRFEDGAEVNPETLHEAAGWRRASVPVKILARGELERKSLDVSAHGFSAKGTRGDRRSRRDLHRPLINGRNDPQRLQRSPRSAGRCSSRP